MAVEPFGLDEWSPVDVRETSIDRTLSAALDSLSLSRASPTPEAEAAASGRPDPDFSQLPPLPPSPEKSISASPPSSSESSQARVALFPAPACALHTYIRTSNSSGIVERPQRLRAVGVGLACAVARLEESLTGPLTPESLSPIPGDRQVTGPDFIQLVSPVAYDNIDIRLHAATDYVHKILAAVEDGIETESSDQVYLNRLYDLVGACVEKVSLKQSEIPAEWPQGDLYLSPGSMSAFQSSIATACAAVDMVVSPTTSPKRAFASVRPPGHHCSAAQPSGFCFLNNVAIAAVHAHLHHSITHVAILDIDLHHGNGTQSIVWAINAATHKQAESHEVPQAGDTPGLQIYYGSLHDILSYPCETGDPALTQAASICIAGAHGQHIENIHLEPYTSDADFWGRLYPQKYSQLLTKADEFFEHTRASPDNSLVLVSCGFDASSHELESMSRHKRNVPPTFYARFAADAHTLADKRANGKAITVLEGGYGDRALQSGAMAYLVGMFSDSEEVIQRENWWSVEELVKIEKAFPAQKNGGRKTARPSNPSPVHSYLARASSLLPLVFPTLTPEEQPLPFSAPVTPAQPHRMGLRDRKALKPVIVADATPPRAKGVRVKRGGKSTAGTPVRLPIPPVDGAPSLFATPTIETVPPLPDTPLERLTSSLQEMRVKTDPEKTPSPRKLSPTRQAQHTEEQSQPPAHGIPLPQSQPSQIPVKATKPSLKFKVRLPPTVRQQLLEQSTESTEAAGDSQLESGSAMHQMKREETTP